jgi:hypothetical protein
MTQGVAKVAQMLAHFAPFRALNAALTAYRQ